MENPNLQLLMGKIFEDEKALERVIDTDNMEELYHECLTIQDGYTMEEFLDYFEHMVYICQDESKGIEKLDEGELNNVSGGVSGFNRMTASVLAALTFFMGSNANVIAESVAIDTVPINSEVELRVAEPNEKAESDEIGREIESLSNNKVSEDNTGFRKMTPDDLEDNLSFGEKVKKWFSKAADFIWDHKVAILTSSVALIVGGVLIASQSKQISKNINKWRKKKHQINKLNEELEAIGYLEGDARDRAAVDCKNIKAQIKVLEGQDTGKILTDKLLVAGTAAGGFRALWGVIRSAYNKLKSFSDVVNVFTNMQLNIQYNLEKYRSWERAIDLWLQMQHDFDYNDGGERLDRLFKKYIHGQEDAKKKLKTFYNIFANALEDEKNGIATKEQLSPQILVLNGPSGTGKTYMAQLLTKCLTNIDPFYISAGAILKDVEASQSAWGGIDVQTAFWTGGKRLGAGKDDNGVSYNCLASYISSTQGSVRVVIVDEYDKLYTSGDKHPLDETFRDILSNTVKNPLDQTPLDLSKTIFICTSNETKASLQGRIVNINGQLLEKAVDKDGRLLLDENGQQKYIRPVLDASGTQICIPHDASVAQRLKGQTCYFDALRYQDYLKIVHDALDDDPEVTSIEDLRARKGTNRIILRQRIHYNLAGVEIDPEGYELIANYAASMPNAARAIVGAEGNISGSVAGNLESALIEQIGDWQACGYKVKNMKLKAIPREEINDSDTREIRFTIKFMGYDDGK